MNAGPDDDRDAAALDRLLATAAWPAMDAAATRRLRATLRDARRPPPWRTPAAVGAAIAAGVAIVAVAWPRRPSERPPIARQTPAPLVAPAPVVSPAARTWVASRPANLYERLALAAGEARRARPVAAPAARVERAPVAPPPSEVTAAARRAIFVAMARPNGRVGADDAAALASHGDARELGLIARCLGRAESRDATAAALARRDDRAGVAMLCALERGGESAALLAAVGRASPATIDALAGRVVDAPAVADRVSAARLIAASDAGLDRLAEIAAREPAGRRAAIAGLLASDAPRARQLVARLERAAPGVAAQVAAVRAELKLPSL